MSLHVQVLRQGQRRKGWHGVHSKALRLLFQDKHLLLSVDVLKSFGFCPMQNKNHAQNPLAIMFVVTLVFSCVAPATSSPRETGTQYFFWWNKGKEQPLEVEGPLMSDIFRLDFSFATS